MYTHTCMHTHMHNLKNFKRMVFWEPFKSVCLSIGGSGCTAHWHDCHINICRGRWPSARLMKTLTVSEGTATRGTVSSQISSTSTNITDHIGTIFFRPSKEPLTIHPGTLSSDIAYKICSLLLTRSSKYPITTIHSPACCVMEGWGGPNNPYWVFLFVAVVALFPRQWWTSLCLAPHAYS